MVHDLSSNFFFFFLKVKFIKMEVQERDTDKLTANTQDKNGTTKERKKRQRPNKTGQNPSNSAAFGPAKSLEKVDQ